MKLLKLRVYRTDKGLFYGEQSGFHINSDWRVNGLEVVRSPHLSYWYFLEGVDKIESVKRQVCNRGEPKWVLITPSTFVEGKIPKTLSIEEAEEYETLCGEYAIGNPLYSDYRRLYRRYREHLPSTFEDVPFEVEYKGSFKYELIDDDFRNLKIDVTTGEHTDKIDLSRVATYEEIEQLLVPELVIHTRPCSVSQDVTYKIVRSHIKRNIDPRVAEITSDYDFCFTVKKVIKINPWVEKVEIKTKRGRSYHPPRFSTRTHAEKTEQIFEMCPEKRYSYYTPIKSFKGDNLADLADNIKHFLDELMLVINSPVVECATCGGIGNIVQKACGYSTSQKEEK